MAISNMQFLLLALTIATILFSGSSNRASADDCSGDLADLAAQCSKYVQIPGDLVPPSNDCCKVVQHVNVPCVCGHVTREIEKTISMVKVVYVAKYCQRPLRSGSKCGSYTVPMA